jgi:aspartyl protease family protein
MSDNGGPWGREPPDPPAPPPQRGVPARRWLIWLAILAALAGGLWLLAGAFPGSLSDPQDRFYLIAMFGFFAVLSSRVLAGRRVQWGQKARHAAIWAGVVAVLVLAFAYQDELIGVGQRVRAEFSSAYPVATKAHELVVAEGEGGGFYVMGQVNGQPVRFLVDTGSSDTVLSPDDAARVGVNMASLSFDHLAETANGTGYGAKVMAASVTVGPIKVENLPLVVNQAPMTSSLLGMTFLRRLDSFQVRGRRLYLTWKGA